MFDDIKIIQVTGKENSRRNELKGWPDELREILPGDTALSAKEFF